MQRHLSISQALLGAGALAAIVLGALLADSSEGQRPAVNSYGGARNWAAIDENSHFVDEFFSTLTFQILNAANASNSFLIIYHRNAAAKGKPARPVREHMCSGTLRPGELRKCSRSWSADREVDWGYFQVRATHPVLMGGYREIEMPHREDFGEGIGSVNRRNGSVGQRHGFDWQQACPPREGAGCRRVIFENPRGGDGVISP